MFQNPEILRKIDRKVVLSPVHPRVRIWTPIPSSEVLFDLAMLDSSVQRVFMTNRKTFEVPPVNVVQISDVYSNDEVLGFSGQRENYRFVGGEYATFVMIKGSLLRPVLVGGIELPTETRVSLLQTKESSVELHKQLGDAQKAAAIFREHQIAPIIQLRLRG